MNKIQIITFGQVLTNQFPVGETSGLVDCLLGILADGFLSEPHATGEMITAKTDGSIGVRRKILLADRFFASTKRCCRHGKPSVCMSAKPAVRDSHRPGAVVVLWKHTTANSAGRHACGGCVRWCRAPQRSRKQEPNINLSWTN